MDGEPLSVSSFEMLAEEHGVNIMCWKRRRTPGRARVCCMLFVSPRQKVRLTNVRMNVVNVCSSDMLATPCISLAFP